MKHVLTLCLPRFHDLRHTGCQRNSYVWNSLSNVPCEFTARPAQCWLLAEKMKSPLKARPAPIRSVGLPVLHLWQRFYDVSRSTWREFTWRGKWRDLRDSRRALKKATMILQDNFNIRFVLYPWDRDNLAHYIRRTQDAPDFKAIPCLVRSGNTAFDVGANLGVYTVLLSRLCGPSGRVWSFEPAPDTYWRLRETLALNRCENVEPVQAAVCESSGTVRMNLFEPKFSAWNSLGKPNMISSWGKPVSPTQSVEVPGKTLDSFCDTQGIKRINFLKVDVEGFEDSVFRGARRLLRERRIDYICFEVSKAPLRGAGVESRQVFESLEVHGYHAYRFEEASGRFQGPVQDSSEYWANFYASWMDLSKVEGTKGPSLQAVTQSAGSN